MTFPETCIYIFNPRLREGGDIAGFHVLNFSSHLFNPRLREGGDNETSHFCYTIKIFQSTPPRRRRPNNCARYCFAYLFQSTPPRRRRLLSIPKQSSVPDFQSTPPRRRRHPTYHALQYMRHVFNPRLREGGDTGLQLIICCG